MKLLMVTRADATFASIAELTHPILREFAKKWKADFLVLSNDYVACTSRVGKILYRIMDVYDLLKVYDRVLNLDSDMVINKHCPNLFEIVPTDKVGAVFEDKGSRRENRWHRIREVQKAWGDIGWKKGYMNLGTFLVSKSHREIFSKQTGRHWEGLGFCQQHFGYHIYRLGFEIFELDWRFNHMSMFSESWNGKPSRFDSYIIHYAGHGPFPDKGNRSRVQLIKDDIKRIYG